MQPDSPKLFATLRNLKILADLQTCMSVQCFVQKGNFAIACLDPTKTFIDELDGSLRGM